MYIGKDAKTSNKIKLGDEARKANLAVFGIKNTGKAYTLIPVLFSQDIKNKNKGVTIVVDTPELAWLLYGICKVADRKVDIIKPSIDLNIINGLLFKPEWNYDDIEQIYSYEKAIKEKRVTIIDMEQERYGEKAVRAVSMLLLQLQGAMTMNLAKKADYSVFIDDAARYIPYIHNLLKYGDYYGFNSVLFFKSREELKDEKIYVDDYIRNYILLQGINYEDAKYFGDRMGLSNDTKIAAQSLMNRGYGEIVYEILREGSFERKVGNATLLEFEEDTKKEYQDKGLYWKKRKKAIDTGLYHYQLSEESKALEEKKETSYSDEIEKDMKKNLESKGKKKVEPEEIVEEIAEDVIEEPNKDTTDENVEDEIPDISEISELELLEEQEPQKGKEPQLNKKIKTQDFKKKNAKVSIVNKKVEETEELPDDEIDELDEDLLEPDGPIEELPSEEPDDEDETLDLTVKKFNFGKDQYIPFTPKNKKISKQLNKFKL